MKTMYPDSAFAALGALPAAYVQAFRQIGLLIGLAEGVFILHERCTAPKLVGFALILTGLAALCLCVA